MFWMCPFKCKKSLQKHPLMSVFICVKYEKNPSRTADVNRHGKVWNIFAVFFTKSWLNDQNSKSLHATHPLVRGIINCTTFDKNSSSIAHVTQEHSSKLYCSHGWITLKISVKAKSHYMQYMTNQHAKNSQHFGHDIFKCFLLTDDFNILIISNDIFPRGKTDHVSVLAQARLHASQVIIHCLKSQRWPNMRTHTCIRP